MPISVLLAGSSVVRETITNLLNAEPEVQVLADAVSLFQTISLVQLRHPQVVILDLHMDDQNLFKPSYVKSRLQTTRLLAVSLTDDADAKNVASRFGAVAFLDGTNLARELISTIKHYATVKGVSG